MQQIISWYLYLISLLMFYQFKKTIINVSDFEKLLKIYYNKNSTIFLNYINEK